ncbi:response regulator [uncultured Lacinutrix sp.]|uniref:tetratricopeptide repeat-containing hybrid sensor histidine kinase/response regulator n=1 Tax=uncultured Lacinutrix sp. TaxID=574032 RepID=UPI00260D4D1B|nr:response regulator [uncultured Lacinutrix sp.]
MKKLILILVLYFIQYNVLAQDYNIKKDSIHAILKIAYDISFDKKYEDAFSKQYFVLEWAKINNNDSIIGEAYNCLGITYQLMENYDKADSYYKKSLIYLKKAGYKSYLTYYHNNMASLFQIKGDIEKSREQFQLSRNIALEIKSKEHSFLPSYNIAVLDMISGNLDSAIPLFEEVIESYIPDSDHQPSTRINAYNALGKIYKEKGNYKLALQKLKIADSIAQEIKEYKTLTKTEKIRYRIYTLTGNKLKAENALLRQIDYLNKSLSSENKELKENLEQKLLDKEKTIELKEAVYQEQQNTLAKTRIFTYIIFALFIGICLIAFLLYKNSITRKNLNNRLTLKNQQLIEAKEKTEYASTLKANFFSTISHELRTPLYAVSGITDILIEDNPKIEQKQYLKTLKSSGEYLLALINNVLQINKFDADKIELNTIDFNLKTLISNITNSLSYLKKENNNIIHIHINKDVPIYLKGDSLKLTQIIINLLSNALKFTHNGNIWLDINVLKKENTNVNLNFSIKDDGIGISKEMQSRIFEDFYQESMHLERNYEGTGLGLAIVKRLLKVMGSTINVESTQNEGSKFYFNINLEEVISCSIDGATNTSELSDFSSKHILIVDDNSINQMITKRILKNKKAKVTVVNCGLEAIRETQENHFDAILMDIHMPNMNGYTTTQNIRKFNTTVPIIALTAVKLDENKKKIFDSGMNDVIVKPFRQEDFFNKLNKFLNSAEVVKK